MCYHHQILSLTLLGHHIQQYMVDKNSILMGSGVDAFFQDHNLKLVIIKVKIVCPNHHQ